MIHKKRIIITEQQAILLTERTSDKVYHFSRIHPVLSMLKHNEIKLAPAFGSSSDNQINNNKLYFLSLSRSKDGRLGYQGGLWGGKVRLNMNGRALSQTHKVVPVNYYGPDMGSKNPHGELYKNTDDESRRDGEVRQNINKRFEMEDRVISDNDSLNPVNKYITSIDVLTDSVGDIENAQLKYLGDELGITVRFFETMEAFNKGADKYAVEVKASSEGVDEIGLDRSRGYENPRILAMVFHRNDKIKSKVYADLKNKFNIDLEKMDKEVEEAKDRTTIYYMSYEDERNFKELSMVLSNFVHNNKRSTDPFMRYIFKLFGFDYKKMGAKNMYDYVYKKYWLGMKRKEDFVEEIKIELKNLFKTLIIEEYTAQRENFENKDTGARYERAVDIPEMKEYIGQMISKYNNLIDTHFETEDEAFKYTFPIHSTESIWDMLGGEAVVLKQFGIIGDEYFDFDNYNMYQLFRFVISEFNDKSYDIIKNKKEEFWNQQKTNK